MTTNTILSRIYAIADAQPHPDLCAALASVARKLSGDDPAAAKAHTITGVITKLPAADQERVVAAVETLRAKA